MALTVRFLVITILALLPATVSAAEPKPAEPSKETIAALEKLGFTTQVTTVNKEGRLFITLDKDSKDIAGYMLILSAKTAEDAQLAKLPPIEVPFALWLSSSGMTDEGVKALAQHKNLVQISTTGSRITPAAFPDIAKCKQLRVLEHVANLCTDDDIKALAPLEELTDLKIIGKLTKECAGSLKQLKKLNRLYVTSFPALRAKDLKELKQLEELSIEWTDDDLKSVSEFPKLKSLSSSKCTDAGLKALAGHGSLTELALSYNKKITDAALKDLGELTKLSKLNIRGTAITKDGAAKLEKSLPKCEITGP